MWGQFVGLIENILTQMHGALGSWGIAIILFTIIIKLLTWPLTSKQLKSSRAMQELQPKIKALQEKYKDDKEKIAQEQMKLFKEMGVNPAMGCLPMVIQLPIFFALYRAILNLATGGAFEESFLFLPTLACPGGALDVCPTTQGVSWPLAVENLLETWPYLILPIFTVVTQFAVSKLMTPTVPTTSDDGEKKNEDPTQAMMKQMTTFMPLMIGFFALQFPAGLALYWATNNVLTYVQHWVLKQQDKGASKLSMGTVAATNGMVLLSEEEDIIDVEVPLKEIDLSKVQRDGKSRRKRRKKRRS
jgi:YidC/Oxa1 family membrane protein insertase